MIHSILLLALLPSFGGSGLSAQDETQTFDQIAAFWLAEPQAAALSIAVARGDEMIYEHGHGLAQVEHGVAADEHTRFRIASVTKQFTAAAVLALVAEERLRLEGRVGDYLPAFEGPGRSVTLHHLLSHTSGIPSYGAGAPADRRAERHLGVAAGHACLPAHGRSKVSETRLLATARLGTAVGGR